MSMESPFSQSDRSFAAPQQSTFSRPMSLEPEPKPCGIPASYPSLCGSNGRLYTVTVASYGSYMKSRKRFVHQGIIPQQFAHEGHVCLLWVHSLIYMQHYSWWRYMSHVIIFTVYHKISILFFSALFWLFILSIHLHCDNYPIVFAMNEIDWWQTKAKYNKLLRMP